MFRITKWEVNMLDWLGIDPLQLIIWLVLISLVIMLIVRELVTWYWKINERIALQTRQILLLERISRELKSINENRAE